MLLYDFMIHEKMLYCQVKFVDMSEMMWTESPM